MAKRKVTFYPGGYYHVYNRGSNRQPIFREEQNYLFLLRRLREQSIKMSISVIAYCLMPNHYHFLLKQDGDVSISELMQTIFNSYSKAFNKMYNRSGTLFEGPFKSIHVDRELFDSPLSLHSSQSLGSWFGQRSGSMAVFILSGVGRTTPWQIGR